MQTIYRLFDFAMPSILLLDKNESGRDKYEIK